MSSGNSQLRTEINRKFEPPIDVLLDPSLLVANRSLEQLTDSTVFASQTQATLGRTPTEPRLGDLYVPATFHELLSTEEPSTTQKTDIWDFYRGQAEATFPGDVINLLDDNNADTHSAGKASDALQWANIVDGSNRQEQLQAILSEEFSFLDSGGIVLARTSRTFEAYRDVGVPTIDVGKAELVAELRETLSDIGYQDPAPVCAFGISGATSTADALAGSILAHPSDILIYRIGN